MAMKAAKDRKEEFYDLGREEDIRNWIERDWNCGKNISRIRLQRWTKHQSALKVSTAVGSTLCGSKAAMTSDWVVPDLMLPLWEEALWPLLDACSVRLRTTATQWNVPASSSSSSFWRKRQWSSRRWFGQHPASWRASPCDAEEADLCARQRGLQLLNGGRSSGPRVEGRK